MKKKWIIKQAVGVKPIEGVSAILQQILAARGIQSETDVREFISDKPKLTFDPFLLKNMDQAADAIIKAAESNKRICIYGDYDADGITSICLMLEFLSHFSKNLTYYIPSRVEEGYGLNLEAIGLIKNDGVDLIITVDCGSTALSEIAYAKSLGMAVIVTDHHTVGDSPPDCLLINPKQEGCDYPFKDLCGCGVAFKLAQGIQRRSGMDKSVLTGLLDLVAIATIGDIVALLSENRTLVKYGLEVINQGKREGIMRLAKAAEIAASPIKSYQIAYIIVPHLNAAGRMAEAEAGVRLFTAKSSKAIQDAALTLASNNTERKKAQEETYKKCIEIVEKRHITDYFIVIDAGDAHEGITGIVAGKIKETYNRPVIVVTKSGGDAFLKGTGRSIEGINIYELMKKQESLFLKFGGHAGACGFLIKTENLAQLRDNLNIALLEVYAQDSDLFQNKLMVDASLKIGDVSLGLIEELNRLEPFGYKNERPVFELPAVMISQVFFMGEDRQHARLNVSDGLNSIDCILFNEAGDYSAELEKGKIVSLAGYPDINIWNGISKIQFVVKDIKCYIKRVD